MSLDGRRKMITKKDIIPRIKAPFNFKKGIFPRGYTTLDKTVVIFAYPLILLFWYGWYAWQDADYFD